MTAPAVKVARTAAGATGRRTGRRSPVPDPRVTAPGSRAAAQREAVEQLKAKRAAEPAPAPVVESPPPASPGGGFSAPSLPALPPAASTGSGFLLGVAAWAVGLAYLRGGWPEVRKFGAAKFFNKTGG
jgi:hypothetical protein